MQKNGNVIKFKIENNRGLFYFYYVKKILITFIVFLLWTCSGGGDGGGGSPTEPSDPTYVVNIPSLNGFAQKGPFSNGTSISVAELTSSLSPTGRNFSS